MRLRTARPAAYAAYACPRCLRPPLRKPNAHPMSPYTSVSRSRVPRSQAGHRGVVAGVVFAPDGRTLASFSSGDVDDEPSVKLWDVAAGSLLHTLHHAHTLSAVCFSPDGATLASASSREPTIRLWRVANGAELRRLWGHSAAGGDASPGCICRELVGSGSDSDGSCCFQDLDDSVDGTSQCPLEGHAEGVTSIAFSPDGAKLCSSAHDGCVKLWIVADGSVQCTLAAGLKKRPGPNAVVFSPDGAVVAASAESAIMLWHTADGRELWTVGRAEHDDAAFDTALCICRKDYEYECWVEDPRCPAMGVGHSRAVERIAFCKRAVAAEGNDAEVEEAP